MSDLYENLLKATNNIDDITTEKYGVITKLDGLYCSVKETDNELEHNNVPIVNGANLSVGDKVIIGFLNNSIYDVVCYGALDKTIHDDSKQDKLISGENIKTINNNSILGSGNLVIEGGGTGVDIVTEWETTTSDSKVASEKLTKDTLDTKVDKENGKGLSSNDFTNNYKSTMDSLKTVATTGSYTDLTNKPSIPSASSSTPSADTSSGAVGTGTTWARADHKHPKSSIYAESSHTHTKSQITDFPTLSTVATTGDYDDLLDKPNIPSKTSDLTNDSNFISTSNTSGLIKNDGTIDTTSYSTFSGSYNDLSNKPSIPSSSSDLSDGSDLVKKSSTSGLLKNDGSVDTNAYITSSAISGKEDTSNKVSSWSSTTNDTHYPTEKLVKDSLDSKQATLVSGTNIKTINNTSLLGSGNISIQGGGSVTVDSALSTTSENPVQNKVITGALNNKADTSSLSTVATSGSYNDLSNKPNIPTAISDLTNDSDFIETSSTTGLIKNDGSIDTTTYSTFDGDYNSLSNKPTIPSDQSIVDIIYPVGSIYMSVSNTSPSILFGGTWEQIKDKFLLSSGDTYSNGVTGGSADAVVVEHTHTQNAHSHTLDNSKKYVVATNNAYAEGVKRLATKDNTGGYYLRSDYASSVTVYTNTANKTATNNETGESGTGKNMPPYLTVNVWKRTA